MEETAFWITDTETTGLHADQGDRIIQIACVEIKNNKLSGREFSTYVDPKNKKISYDAWKVHGIDKDKLKELNALEYSNAYKNFIEIIEDKPLIIHNAEFDVEFFKHNCASDNLEMFDNPVLDSINLAKALWPGRPVSLDILASRLNIPNRRKEKHDALIDCRLLAEVWLAMVQERNNLNSQKTFFADSEIGEISNSDKTTLAWPNNLISFDDEPSLF